MSNGKTPNLLWQAITFEELRRDPRFDGLPPVEELSIEGTHSYRCEGCSGLLLMVVSTL